MVAATACEITLSLKIRVYKKVVKRLSRGGTRVVEELVNEHDELLETSSLTTFPQVQALLIPPSCVVNEEPAPRGIHASPTTSSGGRNVRPRLSDPAPLAELPQGPYMTIQEFKDTYRPRPQEHMQAFVEALKEEKVVDMEVLAMMHAEGHLDSLKIDKAYVFQASSFVAAWRKLPTSTQAQASDGSINSSTVAQAGQLDGNSVQGQPSS